MSGDYVFRPARPEDREAVEALLRASYPPLLAGAYADEILAAAMPTLVHANDVLLSCGTWYVVESGDGSGTVAACGGFTAERPGTGEVEPGLGHLRHFATHQDHVRKGLAGTIVRRSAQAADAIGLSEFEAYSTLVAVPFYAALGLVEISTIELPIPVLGRPGETVPFPSVVMRGPVAPLR